MWLRIFLSSYIILIDTQHQQKNPEYENLTRKTFPIYKAAPKQKKQQAPPKRLPVRQLFNYLNLWEVDPEIKQDYFIQFRKYLGEKQQDIELMEIENTMKKPDFIRFFKYLKKEPSEELDITQDETTGKYDIAYTAAERRKKNQKSKKKPEKYKMPKDPEPVRMKIEMGEDIPNVTPEDFIIVQHFFQSISEGETQLTKDHILTMLLANSKLLEAYEIKPITLEHQLEAFPTAINDMMTLDEFVNFMLFPKHLIIHNHEDDSRSSQQNQIQYQGHLIASKEMLGELRKIYNDLDLSKSNDVPFSQFAKCVRASFETQKYLFQPVFQITKINKKITLEKFLYKIELFHNRGISWDKILEYMENYQEFQIPRKDAVLESKQLSGSVKFDKLYKEQYYILPREFFHILWNQYESMQKDCGGYLQTLKFTDYMQGNDDLMRYRNEKVRIKNTPHLAVETVEQTIRRIQEEMEEFIDYDELVDFFTVKGRPLELAEILKRTHNVNQKPEKKKKVQQNNNTFDAYEEKFGAINKANAPEYLVTIPIKSRLAEEEESRKTIRQQEIEKMLQQKQKEEEIALRHRFKANAVPWYVTQPLYDQINRDKEENRQRIKEEIKQRMLQDSRKLFSFEKVSKAKERNQSPPKYDWEEFRFRARPVPEKSSQLLYDQMMQDKKDASARNIELRKQELMDSCELPVGIQRMMDRDEERKIRKSMSPYHKERCLSSEGLSFEHFRARGMPDFERLHQSFQNQLESVRKPSKLTIPEEWNITATNNKPIDNEWLDYDNASTKQSAQSRSGEIDQRLQKILKTPQNQVYATRKHEDLVEMRKKQRYDKWLANDQEQNELDRMSKERRALLPKGMRGVGSEVDPQKVLDGQLAELVQWKKQYHRNLDRDYGQEKKGILKKVQKRPLLMHTVNRNVQIEEGIWE